MSGEFFRMRGVCKRYSLGGEELEALHDVDLDIAEGDFLSILGPSGSGKTTLMNLIGCLDTLSAGEYVLRGERMKDMDEARLSAIRRDGIGFVFQNSQLLPRLNALENVELPLVYAGLRPRERRARAEELLRKVGLSDRMQHFSNQLSGGQQQRVAIARALANDPDILLADEPTGALDQTTGRQVMELFRALNAEGRTIIMITHDLNVAKWAKRVAHIVDGVLTVGQDWEGGAAC